MKETIRTVCAALAVLIQLVGLFLLVHFRPR